METRICDFPHCKDFNGNCSVPGQDGLPVQCVGSWAEDKYYFLEKYLNATCEVRRCFTDKGNAVFIDLFAGPGNCIIRSTQSEISGGGVRALNREQAPFNEYHFYDILKVNIEALQSRIGDNPHYHTYCGNSNKLVENLVGTLLQKPFKYHVAYIDPFGPEALKFSTIAELAKLQRMDMLIHFPIGAIKRNLPSWIAGGGTILDELLGTNIWRNQIKNALQRDVFKILINIFKEQLLGIGYPEKGLRIAASDNGIYAGLPVVPIKNTKDVELYVLVLVSKHGLAQKIWHSIIKTTPDGQRSLF